MVSTLTMLGVLLFILQAFLSGITNAQCPMTCSECKEFSDGKYKGQWNLIEDTNSYCINACLYQRSDSVESMCFCDPGDIVYEACQVSEKRVLKTVVVENGQIVEQNDTYDIGTGEVTLDVPAHGSYEKATVILDPNSRVLMTSTQDTCRIKSIPNDVNPRDIQKKENDESTTSKPITQDSEKKAYSLVFDAGTASADEISQLSSTMTNECSNKTIKKTDEIKVDKRTFDDFVKGKVIILETGIQKSQVSTESTGCDDEAKACATKLENGCWRWPYGYLDSLHEISGNGFCIPCCKSTVKTGDLCSCTDLTSFDKIEQCLDTCPDGFINFCDHCYADLRYKAIPACDGSCPGDRYKCGDECWPKNMVDDKTLLECKDTEKCYERYNYPIPPCEGKCLWEDDYFLCGNECWPDYMKGDLLVCTATGKCQYKWDFPHTPCQGSCLGEDSYLCGGECWARWDEDYLWLCNEKCQSKWIPCDGSNCPSDYYLCGNECAPNSEKEYLWGCNGSCQSKDFTCDGECPEGWRLDGWYCIPDVASGMINDK